MSAWQTAQSLSRRQVRDGDSYEARLGQTYSSASHTGASGSTLGSTSRKHVTIFVFSRDKEERWTIQSESAVLGEMKESIREVLVTKC